ncbi:hypothetical protein Desti_4057 [Desulfomonile tiedjei DSM 6799]|uniref:Uncharacterized protein n=1 Tax=Desulfomonile tiedjei (strain ATCC 49306 / DSM 6799 / DCB-1) TaxID=706587 RepID=I4CAV5_DESTA|nr:hypothetical protein Desti_4057 [Desulfomonile tiedjei DSM 6799]
MPALFNMINDIAKMDRQGRRSLPISCNSTRRINNEIFGSDYIELRANRERFSTALLRNVSLTGTRLFEEEGFRPMSKVPVGFKKDALCYEITGNYF